MNISELKTTKNVSRIISHKHNHSESLKNILDEQVLNSNDTSPIKPLRSQKSFRSYSTQNSAMKSRRGSKSKFDKLASIYIDKENENDHSVSRVVQFAYDIQMEKEKEIQKKKENVEKEIISLRNHISNLAAQIKLQRECLNSKQLNLLSLMKEAEKIVNSDGHSTDRDKTFRNMDLINNSDSSDKDVEKKELLRALLKVNKNLGMDLKMLSDYLNKETESLSNFDLGGFRSLVNNAEQNLQSLLDEKNLLVHKIYEAEDKINQAREMKNMIAEDFASHVVAMTECVVLQEETEGMLESIKTRNPECFHLIMKDAQINDTMVELGIEIKRKEEIALKLSKEVQEDEAKYNSINEEVEELSRAVEALKETSLVLRNEILTPKLSIYDKLKEAIKLLPKATDNFSKLLSFFKIFDTKGLKLVIQNLSEKHEDILVNFHSLVLDEIIFIFQNKQDIENLEATLLKLHTKSLEANESKYDASIVMKSLQDEVIHKKLLLTEKAVQFELQKKNLIINLKTCTELDEVFKAHISQSLYEIIKKICPTSDPSTIKKLDQIILILANSAKDNYGSYLEIKDALKKKNEEIVLLREALKPIEERYQANKVEFEKVKVELMEKKMEEEKLTQSHLELQDRFQETILKETEKAYQHYIAEQDKKLKKLKFQYGKNYLDKLSSTMLNEYFLNQSSSLNKLRNEIQEAHLIIRRMEEYRANTSQKIEHELKKAFEKAKKQLVCYQSKLEVLNRELVELLEKEQEYTKNIDKDFMHAEMVISQDSLETGLPALGHIYTNLQLYKKGISDLLCKIIEGLVRSKSDGGCLLTVRKSQLQQTIKQIQEELTQICESEMKSLEEYEREIKAKQDTLQEKESYLALLKVQMEKYQNFCEISTQLFKSHFEKENLLNTSNLNSAKNSEKKKLAPSKSTSRLYGPKENVKVSKLMLDTSKAFPFTSEIMTPKVLSEVQGNILSGIESSSSCRSLAKNHSSVNFSLPSYYSGFKPSNSERSALSSNEPGPSKFKQEKIPKYLFISNKRFADLKKEFEFGLPVLKKFLNNNSLIGPGTLNSKGTDENQKELKKYGKRSLRLNTIMKTLEIVKLTNSGFRPIVEYSYEWKAVKNLVLPNKTVEYLKSQNHEKSKESPENLPFSIDIHNNGRLDFLTHNGSHIVLLWNLIYNTQPNSFNLIQRDN